MNIEYKNAQIRKVCTDANAAIKKYGTRMADVLHQRIDQITASENVEMLIRYESEDVTL